jgi:hypothetical protein
MHLLRIVNWKASLFLGVFAVVAGCNPVGVDPNAMNSLRVLTPYKHAGMWVFDDPAVGLNKEPFVSGADDIMDLLSADIPGAKNGFNLVFSAQPFPGYQARFVRTRAEHEGTWYAWPEREVEGWLCPALFKYFPVAPEEIYVKAGPRKAA